MCINFPRSGDVIHPQLWESGSGAKTNPATTCMSLMAGYTLVIQGCLYIYIACVNNWR